MRFEGGGYVIIGLYSCLSINIYGKHGSSRLALRFCFHREGLYTSLYFLMVCLQIYFMCLQCYGITISALVNIVREHLAKVRDRCSSNSLFRLCGEHFS